MRRNRRNHAAGFNAKMALVAVKGDKTVAELAKQCEVHPTQIVEWKQLLVERAADVFGAVAERGKAAEPDLKVLHAKIGQLALENDFLEGALIKAGMLSAKR